MKKCLKCNNDLPNIIVIDGKRHNICNRKFCLECSPFKMHNTTNLLTNSLEEGKTKKCSICKLEKNTDEFYKKRDQARKQYSSTCRSCENIRSIQRQRDLKQKAIDYKGGCCQICNYDKYNGALEFHHKDPSIKDFSLGHAKMYSFEKVKSELDKCLLVCANCHREIHGRLIEIPPE
jgi:predicted HNH restriction endonuclease